MAKLLLVSQPSLFTDLLSAAFEREPGFEVKGVVPSFAEALKAVATSPPDLALVNYRLPDATGLSAIRGLLQQCRSMRALMLSPSDALELVAAAVQAGCSGIITVHHSLEEVRRAVFTVSAGATAFSPEILAQAMNLLLNPQSSRGLTPRELEVLQALATGKSVSDIAGILQLSLNTVRSHMQQIQRKLDAHSKFEALEAARRRGLIYPGA